MSTRERVEALLLPGLSWPEERDRMATVAVAPAGLRALLEGLAQKAGFECPTLVTAIDHHPREPRFELIWQLLSMQHGDRLRVRCLLEPGEPPTAPSGTDLWSGAAYMERECYDMFGIVFSGHEDLRRLLMPDGYGHHPLRKDFPHQGIEPDRLYREWEARRLAQCHGGQA